MSSPIDGQCLCKKVQYKLHAEPKAVGCCYCKSCQIKSGSDHIVYLAFEHDAVTLEGEIKWYTSIGDSGLLKQHGFCPECGANLFAKPEHWSHLLIVYAGSLIDSSNYAPKTNLCVKDAPKWSCMNESLISFEGNPG
ncbi:GFA family protein [Legionella israelensis]|uniref:Glutathione-dependent formaldehyde-activating enzyme n=1 Tax=Legionella israelensis TaxID=454 RepID=A0A0W0WK59_9GAMM|nr:GFA family protein [Legionella israelensis]KTD32709.1 Glutathione-dependent formaldehyde-activating enzyme [Legionella israelensis]SCY35803.1 Uncharacterized conserved protein [Legionella israelensis DSM 19235]STX58688.1 Uncharacterized conserved protein [Legionella israelensis]